MAPLLMASMVALLPFGASVRMTLVTTGKNSPTVSAWMRRAASMAGKFHASMPSADPARDAA